MALYCCLFVFLQDILKNEDSPLDDMFITSLVQDLYKVNRLCIHRLPLPHLYSFAHFSIAFHTGRPKMLWTACMSAVWCVTDMQFFLPNLFSPSSSSFIIIDLHNSQLKVHGLQGTFKKEAFLWRPQVAVLLTAAVSRGCLASSTHLFLSGDGIHPRERVRLPW